MAYARVLMAGEARLGDADGLFRLREALRARGHAVAWLRPDAGGAPSERKATSFVREFRPTLVLWDARSCPTSPDALVALCEAGCLVVVVGSCAPAADAAFDAIARLGGEGGAPAGSDLPAIPLLACADGSYVAATTSVPAPRRAGLAVFQARTPERAEALDAALAAMRDALGDSAGATCAVGVDPDPAHASLVAFDRTWGDAWRDPSLSGAAFAARQALACALFDGDDAPAALDAALRLAEGCAVLVERSLVERWAAADPVLARAVVAFDGADGLAAAAAAAVADPAAAAARAEAFAQSRPPLEAALDGLLADLDALARRIGRAPVLSQELPTKNVVAYGWFGMRNFGDDLLLMTSARRIREGFPEACVSVVGGNADEVESSFGMEAVTPDRKYELAAALSRARALYFCGGVLFDDPMQETAGAIETFMDPWIEPSGQAATCLTAWLDGARPVFLGAGAGPLAKPAARSSARLMALAGTRFLMRDENSARLLREAGVPEGQVAVRADLAFSAETLVRSHAADPLPGGLEPDGYLTVSLRTWPLNPPGFEDELAAAIDEVAAACDVRVLFLPFDPDDVRIHRAVADRMRERQRVVMLEDRPAEAELLAAICGSRAAFAMRLHCSILHHVLGKPAVGLDYNDKIGAHFRSIGQEGLLFPLGASSADLAAGIRAALTDESLPEAIASGVAPMAGRADEAFDELFRIIEEHDGIEPEPPCFHPRGISLARMQEQRAAFERDEARRERDAALARAEAAERALAEMESSRSWKLGHALMRVPHAIAKGK